MLCALRPHDRYAPDNVERILRTLLLTKVPPTPKRQQLRTRPGSAQKHDGRSANRWYATEGVSGLLVRDGRLSKAPGDAKGCGSRAAAAWPTDVQNWGMILHSAASRGENAKRRSQQERARALKCHCGAAWGIWVWGRSMRVQAPAWTCRTTYKTSTHGTALWGCGIRNSYSCAWV